MTRAPGAALRRRRPLTFFALVFALSIPFWVAGALSGAQVLPGLPVADAFITLCPLVAASILVHRADGAAAVKGLLKRAVDYERLGPRVWYLPIILLMPAATFAAYWAMRAMGLPLPDPNLPWRAVPAMFIGFFVGAVAEEVGWTGYATDALQPRCTALQTGILVGLVCAAWHIIQLVQLDRSPAWIVWWSLWTVSARVLFVWVYDNTGESLFAVVLFHAMMNLSWQMFPNSGSHWDPRFNGLALALAAAVVTVLWGPRTLARSPREAQRSWVSRSSS